MKLIVAIEENNGIGNLGDLPWETITEDMAQFMHNTMEDTLIMGKVTWDSLSRNPLPGRTMVVISRKKIRMPAGHFWYSTPAEAFAKHPQAWVIGGSSIYSEAMASGKVNEMLVSHIKGMYTCDRHFRFNKDEWKTVETENFKDFTQVRYVKESKNT